MLGHVRVLGYTQAICAKVITGIWKAESLFALSALTQREHLKGTI